MKVAFYAIAAGLLVIHSTNAEAQTLNGIEVSSPASAPPAAPVRGGIGANFVVDRATAGKIAELAVAGLIVGGVGAGHYAFISQGRPVRLVGKN
jgi:hypothetical protein